MASELPTEIYSFYRINVVGGSGKSTRGKFIAKTLGYRYIELDEIQWKPNCIELT